MTEKKFYGKYRGKVTNNFDPLVQGRIQVSVPSVLGDGTLSWAMPCVPCAGPQVGFCATPAIGASVWVEFEGGDIDNPIWSGCFWGPLEYPVLAALPTTELMIKTTSGIITIDKIMGISIETQFGTKIDINPLGIEITGLGSSIEMTGPQVSINKDALKVLY